MEKGWFVTTPVTSGPGPLSHRLTWTEQCQPLSRTWLAPVPATLDAEVLQVAHGGVQPDGEDECDQDDQEDAWDAAGCRDKRRSSPAGVVRSQRATVGLDGCRGGDGLV